MNKPDFNNPKARREAMKVPEGYFDNFTKQMMAMIPDDDAKTQDDDHTEPAEGKVIKVPFWKTNIYTKLRPYIYLAAMMSGLYFGIWIYNYQKQQTGENTQVVSANVTNSTTDEDEMTAEEMEKFINDACDYMMTDSYDIMACVTGIE